MVWECEHVFVKTSRLAFVCVCVVSPGLPVCVSDVNSVLSARFSTLPAAVKRARPSLPPPRGLISFFILSAIQLDFLWGHKGQGPFTKREEPGDCVCVYPDFPENTRRMCHDGYILFASIHCVCFLIWKFKMRTKIRVHAPENRSADFHYSGTKHRLVFILIHNIKKYVNDKNDHLIQTVALHSVSQIQNISLWVKTLSGLPPLSADTCSSKTYRRRGRIRKW